MERYGEPSIYGQGEAPADYWSVEYKNSELWFGKTDRRLWRIKVMHPLLQCKAEGLVLHKQERSMRCGGSEVRLGDIDTVSLTRLPTAIDATCHLGFAVRGTRSGQVKQINLYQAKNGLILSLSYVLNGALVGMDEQDFDYYLHGIYVDDDRGWAQ